MRLRKTIALTGSVVALALGAAPALADDASVSVSPADCDIVVAPNGSDSNPGTVEAPMATSNKAAAALQAGRQRMLAAARAEHLQGSGFCPVTCAAYMMVVDGSSRR